MTDFSRVLLAALLCITGCTGLSHRQETRYVDPKLPMSMSCAELVHHLNQQHPDLQGWRCTDVTATPHMQGVPPIPLSGFIACRAPNHFRLKAANVVSQTDLGANTDRCWFYVKPGPGEIFTWRHEDAGLLHQFGVNIPRIDPEWLMVVMGVVPVRAEDFEISSGPAGSSELWLTAVIDNFDGQSLRRVIKVDTISGRVREHVIYDHERNPLVRARISEYRTVQNNLLPRRVSLEFPAMDSRLSLEFGEIEANCELPDALWNLPADHNVKVTDLGNVVRAHAGQSGAAGLADLDSAPGINRTVALTENQVLDGSAAGFTEPTAETEASVESEEGDVCIPEWDTPAASPPRSTWFSRMFGRRSSAPEQRRRFFP
jgi:hypothetical protein